jgi:hypothetical protein
MERKMRKCGERSNEIFKSIYTQRTKKLSTFPNESFKLKSSNIVLFAKSFVEYIWTITTAVGAVPSSFWF